MHRLIAVALCFTLFACTSKNPKDRAIASATPESDIVTADQIQNHPEPSMPLPFDPMYKDLNHDGITQDNEIFAENIRKKITSGQEILAKNPLRTMGLERGQLILTVDDGPNVNVTPKILNLLDTYNIKATFFLTGDRIPTRQALVREMVARGHTIGNHTYSHVIEKITAGTIVSEMRAGYRALTEALGHEPEGRMLFRAPGLGWSEPKAIAANSDGLTRTFIGPMHANIGTDAPRADWSCWSKKYDRTAEDCAELYYRDIMEKGRGIVLAHDVYYEPGHSNTYEMLAVLLRRLDNEGGGIKNKDGHGVWEFVTLADRKVLDQFDVKKTSNTNVNTNVGNQGSVSSTGAKASQLKPNMLVRTEVLARTLTLDDQSKIPVNGSMVITDNLVTVTDLKQDLRFGNYVFKKVRVEQTQRGFEFLNGKIVYISASAFLAQ